MNDSRRGFLTHLVRGGLAGTAALAAYNADGFERVLEASQAVAHRAPEDVAQDEIVLARDPVRLHPRPHHHQPQQRRRVPQPARGARGVQALPRHHQPVARVPHVADPRAERRERAAPARPRVRVRRGGARHHAQRERVAADRAAGHRPEAGRRGADHRPGLPAHAHDVGAAGAPRRHHARRRSTSRCRRRASSTWPTCSRRPSRRARR